MLATLAATLILAQQTPAAAVATKAGAPTLVYAGVLEVHIQTFDAKLTFTSTHTSTKKDDGTSFAIAWSKCLLNMGGEERDLPDPDPFTYLLKADGALGNVTGGQPEVPAGVFVPLMHLMAPKEALEVGKSAERTVAKTDDIGAIKVTVKRLDDDKVDGQSLAVYEQTALSDDKALDAVGKFWAKADGTVVKIEQNLKSIKVGDSGETGSGKMTLNLKK